MLLTRLQYHFRYKQDIMGKLTLRAFQIPGFYTFYTYFNATIIPYNYTLYAHLNYTDNN